MTGDSRGGADISSATEPSSCERLGFSVASTSAASVGVTKTPRCPTARQLFDRDALSRAAQRASLVGLRPYRAISLRECSCQAQASRRHQNLDECILREARGACIRQKCAPGESLIECVPTAEETPRRTAATICAGDALTRVMHTPILGRQHLLGRANRAAGGQPSSGPKRSVIKF